jgi:hypothetical protein
MLILHANWSAGSLRLWGESLHAFRSAGLHNADRAAVAGGATATAAVPDASIGIASDSQHPFAADITQLLDELRPLSSRIGANGSGPLHADSLTLILPHTAGRPIPSERLMNVLGVIDLSDEEAAMTLEQVRLPSVRVDSDRAIELLLRLEATTGRTIQRGYSLHYWTEVARFVLGLLVDQRFVPSVLQSKSAGLAGAWQPWLLDSDIRRCARALIESMPPIVRAVVDDHEHTPHSILNESLTVLADATIRRALIADGYHQTLEAIEELDDPHTLWLRGLLGNESRVTAEAGSLTSVELFRDVSHWIARLDTRSVEDEADRRRSYTLVLRLNEPELPGDGESIPAGAGEFTWRLSYHLAPSDEPGLIFDADDIWNRTSSTTAGKSGRQPRAEHPEEALLTALTRAGQIYDRIAASLNGDQPDSDAGPPTGVDLTTDEADAFLREHLPVLEEAGVRVQAPNWWDSPTSRLGVMLHLDTPPSHQFMAADSPSSHSADNRAGAPAALGLQTLVDFRWDLAIGEETLSQDEFRRLLDQSSPLVPFRGRWVAISDEDRLHAKRFLEQQSHGKMTLLEALQRVSRTAGDETTSDSTRENITGGLPVAGLHATGWFGDLLTRRSEEGSAGDSAQRMPMLEQPQGFHGELRPYQRSGLSWLAFIDQFGLGACLADDMGLGKTIQLIALLLYERSRSAIAHDGESNSPGPGRDDKVQINGAPDTDSYPGQDRGYVPGERVGPTLLIVPTSVVSNWHRELARFAPSLRVHIQHGPERPSGEGFDEAAREADVVITTYALVSRDFQTLSRQPWHRIVLDEAQYIKNPPTKQAKAIRSLPTARRIALTGTPVENRLSELWSIMEFCNPGYLGSAPDFRRRYALPIERHRDPEKARMLRMMVRPFVLRRLKSDPQVINDLPPCVESKEYATLTREQATLYERVVQRMLKDVDTSDGMQRRGLILATLVKLKQICNHPLQLAVNEAVGRRPSAVGIEPATENHESEAESRDPSAECRKLAQRSGKARRLIELLEEVVASDEKALVFTQFRQMGHLLTTMIRDELDCDVLFLHGGTPAPRRQQFIDRFQDERGGAPVFVLSLKAGGLGLNLTAANHVFHFDRWWNPAVENQATDRAFRIGQTRTVQVHKFVCQGTLEERIDEMIDQKTALAENVIGAGEQWLTELSTSQLRDLLMLRQSATEVTE